MNNQPNDHMARQSGSSTGRPQAASRTQNAVRTGASGVAAPHTKPAGAAAATGPTRTAAVQGASGTMGSPNGGSKRTVLIVAGCVVAALAVWLLVWLFACNGSSLFDPSAQTGQAPYKSAEEMQAELDRVVDEGMFNISIASTIQFADGTSSGTAFIENVPGNRYNMQVAITDDATGETLYESGVLSPNQYIQDITLARDLDPGTYEATATFTALDPTTYDEVGHAAAKIAVVVQG